MLNDKWSCEYEIVIDIIEKYFTEKQKLILKDYLDNSKDE